MLLCKKIKLNVTEQDAATLEFMQAKCSGLYNWWVLQEDRNGVDVVEASCHAQVQQLNMFEHI
jgi:hypothetical protein